jgi:hypothetical protein
LWFYAPGCLIETHEVFINGGGNQGRRLLLQYSWIKRLDFSYDTKN